MTTRHATTPNLFDREEMMRLTREGMEQTLRFYMTMNEQLLKMAEWQKDAVNQANQQGIEMLNKAYDEYQKNSRVVLTRLEAMIRQAAEQTAPKAKEQGQ
ncbi:MAG: hypothetical protein OZSIB_3619 [Candidatus Ozemobacter sibiricus]|jgi:hypothetical protein|uniref:Phasin domain-containing protein n=1 Tax=Candidatus Ozemobacter sibiricus TaxID=2268124 RepID=A0A367ZPP7_9BACT|nr:MAG: hypothetical protein OZSIB_3619 [Candidatus Ozemobacter sibiricus]